MRKTDQDWIGYQKLDPSYFLFVCKMACVKENKAEINGLALQREEDSGNSLFVM